jgi:hypothetical protein
MPEKGEEGTKAGSWVAEQGLKKGNWTKRMIAKIPWAPRMRYRKPGKEKEYSVDVLKKERTLNEQFLKHLEGIEQAWLQLEDKAPKVRTNILELYKKMGPYTDIDATYKEYFAYKWGTSPQVDPTKKPKYVRGIEYDTVKDVTGKDFKVFDVPIEVPVPKQTAIPAPDGNTYRLRSYGADNYETWFNIYNDFMTNVFFPKVSQVLKDKAGSDQEMISRINDIIAGLSAINTKLLDGLMMADVEGKPGIGQHEAGYREDMDSRNTACKEAEKLREDQLIPRSNQGTNINANIHYYHTYLIIKFNEYTDEQGHVHKITDDGRFFQRDGELELGLDENGWPLEVDKDGSILLDKFSDDPNIRSSPRKVKEEFFGYMDLMQHGIMVINELDIYRDSVRDARYNPWSLLASDYAKISSLDQFREWGRRRTEDWLHSHADQFKTYTQHFQQGGTFTGYRKPNNLSPAFDKRAMDDNFRFNNMDFRVIGRKHYYGAPRDTFKVSRGSRDPGADPILKDLCGPRVTSRGLAQHIIDNIVRSEDTMEDINNAISRFKEFDYGPRLFGDPFWSNPFAINYSQVQSKLDDRGK